MTDEVELYHPALDLSIRVPRRSAWVRLRSGWRYARVRAEQVRIVSEFPMPTRLAPQDKE